MAKPCTPSNLDAKQAGPVATVLHGARGSSGRKRSRLQLSPPQPVAYRFEGSHDLRYPLRPSSVSTRRVHCFETGTIASARAHDLVVGHRWEPDHAVLLNPVVRSTRRTIAHGWVQTRLAIAHFELPLGLRQWRDDFLATSATAQVKRYAVLVTDVEDARCQGLRRQVYFLGSDVCKPHRRQSSTRSLLARPALWIMYSNWCHACGIA
jgi:hypothetical protein